MKKSGKATTLLVQGVYNLFFISMLEWKKNRKGFTLIELLVVLGIIGLLTTLSVVAVRTARTKSKISKAKHDIDQIYKAISMMSNDTGYWPNHQTVDTVCATCSNNELCGPDLNGNDCATGGLDDEVAGIILDDSGSPYSNWSGPYMPSMPEDPWGREYFFDTDYAVKNTDGTPCDGLSVPVDCRYAVVIGSYGPDQEGRPSEDSTAGAFGGDDVIKVIR